MAEDMTVADACFEYAAAFADLCKILKHHPDTGREELIGWVRDAYDLDKATAVMEREGINREDGYDPYSVREAKD